MASNIINGGAKPNPISIGPLPIATFSDGADGAPIPSLRFGIEPKQSGSGDPSPQNIRPITGWTAIDGRKSGADTSDYTSITLTIPGTPGTVYGGYWDVVNGKLVVDCVKETFTKDSGWYSFTTGTGNSSATVQLQYYQNCKYVDGSSSRNGAISSTGKEAQNYWINARQNEVPSDGDMCFAYSSTGQLKFHRTDVANITDLSSFKSNFPDTEIVYYLATPIEYSVTPITNLTTLLGVNNIWCDSGETTVGYVSETLQNPTGFPALPFITLEMTDAGVLNVGGKAWSIGSYNGTLYCDSENMDWYDSTQLQNSLVTGDGFPVLEAGDTSVFYSGGISSITIDPRWRAL